MGILVQFFSRWEDKDGKRKDSFQERPRLDRPVADMGSQHEQDLSDKGYFLQNLFENATNDQRWNLNEFNNRFLDIPHLFARSVCKIFQRRFLNTSRCAA